MKKLCIILSTLFLLTPLLSCKPKMLPVKDVKIIRQDGAEFVVAAEMAIKPEDRNRGFMDNWQASPF